jgi:Fur family ferric uptake transcriptional regulator
MDSEKEVFRKYLKQKGLKFTPEREIILDEVFTVHEHFDVEDLYQRLRDKEKYISRPTIYRTISLLVDSGLVRKTIRQKERDYYEHIYGHEPHEHLVCINCGKVIEFNDERVEKIIEEVARKHNFKMVEHKFEIKGFCNSCR